MAIKQQLLQVQNLSFSFSQKERQRLVAVNDVSFTIDAGQSLGLVGESGSGKTLTALSLMRLTPESGQFDDGQILWKGNNILDYNERALQNHRGKQIGMIFQEPLSALNPVMRCGHQVQEAVFTHITKDKKNAKDLTLKWLEKVRLNDPQRIYQAYPHQLSGGQRQRVMIAMALCTEPELLVADEPTTALDVTIQKEILELVNTLQNETGVAVLFISHDLGVVKQVTDNVLVMKDGQIVEAGTTATTFANPQHPYTKGLLACRPPLKKRVSRLPIIADFLGENPPEIGALLKKYQALDEDRKAREKLLNEANIILEVNDLSVWFIKEKNWLGTPKTYTKAVDGISFELKQGQIIGIVGESGSGKTTLGRAIMKLVGAKAGKIIYKNQNLLEFAEDDFRHWREKIQMVFQDPFSSLNPKFTVGETLEEPLLIHEKASSKTDAAALVLQMVEKVGLSANFLERYPEELSGGQRQRVGLARALLLNPEILICDESVSALDVSVQAQVLNLIMDLQKELGFSLLFISHDLSVVKHISDYVLVMKNGQVVERGASDELFANAKHPYTQKLISAIPAL